MVVCVINTYSGHLKHPQGIKKKVIFPVSLLPKVPVLHLCISVTALKKNHFMGLSKTIQTYTQLILELLS